MAKKDESEKEWEASIGWDHPLVQAGAVPGHLVREFLGIRSDSGWSVWLNKPEHQSLYKTECRRPIFWMPTLLQYLSNQGENSAPPAKEQGTKRAKKAQPGHNRKE